MEKHIFDLIQKSGQTEIRFKAYLNSTIFGTYEWREEQEIKYYCWVAGLDRQLLFEANRIIQRVKAEGDSPLSKIAPQNNSINTSGDCFIVTATFGTPYTKEVLKYRNFRDQYLSRYLLGRLFIYLYNFGGPVIAGIVKRNLKLKASLAKVLGGYLPSVT